MNTKQYFPGKDKIVAPNVAWNGQLVSNIMLFGGDDEGKSSRDGASARACFGHESPLTLHPLTMET